MSGFARYLDINANGVNDANDQLIIPFDQNVSVNVADSTHFDLPVTGDTFGVGATVTAGPASNEVTITLGISPNFKTRQDFLSTVTEANSASGIDVAASMTTGAIQGVNGLDAVPSVPIDLIPAYVASSQLLGTNNSRSVALGDLDGDGDLDMVVTNQSNRADSSEANRVYINDGRGRFIDSNQAIGANSSSVVLGDVDGDGDLDIVVGGYNGGNRVYTNVDGAGSFTDSGQVLSANNRQSVALSDVDGDGDLDMVVANSAEANWVYRNDGLGNFNDSNQLLGANPSFSIALGDVDGDGDLDMVVANININRVYKNSDGAGNFIDSGEALGLNIGFFVALGDVDSDGDLDVVVANGDDQANRVYKNNRSGSFADSGQTLGTNSSQSIVLGDLDGDGDLDMVVANRGRANRIYTNDGTGSFTDSDQLLGANFSTSVAVGDLDGDGDLDMVVANGDFAVSVGGEANRVYLNSLAGTEGTE